MGTKLVISVYCLFERFKWCSHALYLGNNLVG